jgi:hypothetical protein
MSNAGFFNNQGAHVTRQIGPKFGTLFRATAHRCVFFVRYILDNNVQLEICSEVFSQSIIVVVATQYDGPHAFSAHNFKLILEILSRLRWQVKKQDGVLQFCCFSFSFILNTKVS